MADTLTPNYQFTQPQDGGSSGTWGAKLIADLLTLDSVIGLPRPALFANTTGAFNFANGLWQTHTVTADVTYSLAGWPTHITGGASVGSMALLAVTNGGAHVITWPAVTWISGSAPTLQAAGEDIILLFTFNEGTTVYGVHLLGPKSITAAQLQPLSVATAAIQLAAVTAAQTGPKERVMCEKLTTQNLTNGVPAAVAFDGTDAYDSGSLHSASTNNSRITVPAAWTGTEVELVAQVTLNSLNSVESFDVYLRKNGTTELARSRVILASGSSFPAGLTNFPLQVEGFDDSPALNDYYEVIVDVVGVATTIEVAGTWFRAKRGW